MASSGIDSMPEAEKRAILDGVRSFSAFTPGDDPYGEHDFGAFTHKQQRVIFKIDYYDKELDAGSEDPSDAGQTTRVLTIMLAHEY